MTHGFTQTLMHITIQHETLNTLFFVSTGILYPVACGTTFLGTLGMITVDWTVYAFQQASHCLPRILAGSHGEITLRMNKCTSVADMS